MARVLDAGACDDEGGADAAFSDVVLKHAEGSRTDLRPSWAVTSRRALLAPVLRPLVEIFQEPFLGLW